MTTASLVHKFFPTPQFLEMPATSFSFSDSSLRMLELHQEKGVIKILNYHEEALEYGVIERGEIKDPESFQQALSKFKERYKINFIKCVLPEENGFVYATPLPQETKKIEEVREYVEFNLEENVPLNTEDAVFDVRDCLLNGGNRIATVFVFPYELVKQYIDSFEAVGMIPLSFESESRALARSVIARGNKYTYMVIQIKERSTNFFLVYQEQVVLVFTVRKGSQELVSDQSSEDDNWLRNKLRQVEQYWKNKVAPELGAESQIEGVITCGEGLERDNVIKTVAKQLGTQVEIANVWKNITSFEEYVPEIPYNESLRYGSVIGLASKQLIDQ